MLWGELTTIQRWHKVVKWNLQYWRCENLNFTLWFQRCNKVGNTTFIVYCELRSCGFNVATRLHNGCTTLRHNRNIVTTLYVCWVVMLIMINQFFPLVSSYTLWNHRKTSGVRMFAGAIKNTSGMKWFKNSTKLF